ncbi:3'(2'),5'-bisphosphate nucleotidase CysQ [Marivita sp. S0852]|uniref:3'(2'),5'-bisphosphate nucleotidase CysQ n=1 Tax=Marivita sp. S0852 TaxID=3373893 RepID=UPI003981C1E8
MPETDLGLLIDAAKAAGDIALREKARGLDVEEKPGGAGPVTQADLAVDNALREALTDQRPGYAWLSEETEDDLNRLDAETVFIVDPIDGTRSFIKGDATWAHSLAIVRNGVVTHGVVYLPEMDLLYAADLSGGATCNDVPINVSPDVQLGESHILATKPNMEPRHWRGHVPDFKRAHRPSLAFRLSLVAQGRYDAMLTLRPSWEWDIAAGALIMSEAGAKVTDRHGQALVFNNPVPQTAGVLGAAPDLHRQIAGALVYPD